MPRNLVPVATLPRRQRGHRTASSSIGRRMSENSVLNMYTNRSYNSIWGDDLGPLLSADEERRLAAAIAQGDQDARNQMVRANLRLVVRISRDYLGRGLGL